MIKGFLSRPSSALRLAVGAKLIFFMKYIIDSHSHIQFPVYDSDRSDVIARALESGVKMIAVGTQISTSEAGIRLAKENPENIWASVGYHPSHVLVGRSDILVGTAYVWHHDRNEQSEAEPEKFDIGKLSKLAADPMVVAIGECGLDYFRLSESEKSLAPGRAGGQAKVKSLQKEVFLQQAELAQKLNKALMIHCRPAKGTDDAYEDLLSMIPDEKFPIPKIVHFYVGGPEITRKLVDAGFYFTLGGVVTFARDYDGSIRLIPADRILLETDCPYVAPKSRRGKRNEPSFIRETAETVARIKDMGTDDFLKLVYVTSRKVFRI